MNKSYLSKTDTKVIKGFAIILMLMHHLWFFPSRLYGGELKHLLNVFGSSSIYFLGGFGSICISIFLFLGGYGMYISSESEDFNIFNSIKKLFIKYWKVFLIVIPISFLFFSSQVAYSDEVYVYSMYKFFNLKDFFSNLLSFSCSYNFEWWFLHCYLVAIITFPLFKKIFEKKSDLFNIGLIIVLTILMTNVFPALGNIKALGELNTNFLYKELFTQVSPYVSCFWMGILFAKSNFLSVISDKLKSSIGLNIFIDMIGILVIIFLRQAVTSQVADIILVPFLVIFFMDFVRKFKVIGKVFNILGENSTNMWLVHTFYCYYFITFAKVVTYFKWGVPCLLVLIALSLISSFIIDYIWKGISFIKDVVFKLFNKRLKV